MRATDIHRDLVISVFLCLHLSLIFALSTAIASPETWLDRPLSNWNQPSLQVPQAPASSGGLTVRCKDHARAAENLADQALLGAGWLPFAALQNYGSTLIITAMSEADASCDPKRYQVFVFSEGKVAGTLSPEIMDFRKEGSIKNIRLLNATEMEVDFLRAADASSAVHFAIQQNAAGPVLAPVEVHHSRNVAASSPAPVVPPAPAATTTPPISTAPPVAVVNPPASPPTAPLHPVTLPAPISPPPTKPPDSLLGPIQDSAHLKGCGCFFKRQDTAGPNDPYIFTTEVLVEKRAWIHVNGQDTPLRLLRSTLPKGKVKLSQGFRFQEEFGTSDLHAVVDYTVKQISGNDKGWTDYDVTITFTAGDRKEVVQSSCSCGCIR
jgi:hypothetical protein